MMRHRNSSVPFHPEGFNPGAGCLGSVLISDLISCGILNNGQANLTGPAPSLKASLDSFEHRSPVVSLPTLFTDPRWHTIDQGNQFLTPETWFLNATLCDTTSAKGAVIIDVFGHHYLRRVLSSTHLGREGTYTVISLSLLEGVRPQTRWIGFPGPPCPKTKQLGPRGSSG